MSKQFDDVTTKIKATSDAAKQMQSDITASVTQNSGLANLDPTTVRSGVGLVAGLSAQRSDIARFIRELGLARKKGLSDNLYKQILAQGPTAGLPELDELLAQPGQTKLADQQQAVINRLTSHFATSSVNAKYDAALDKQVNKLEDIRKAIEAERGDIQDLVSDLGKLLNGIASTAKRRAHAKASK